LTRFFGNPLSRSFFFRHFPAFPHGIRFACIFRRELVALAGFLAAGSDGFHSSPDSGLVPIRRVQLVAPSGMVFYGLQIASRLREQRIPVPLPEKLTNKESNMSIQGIQEMAGRLLERMNGRDRPNDPGETAAFARLLAAAAESGMSGGAMEMLMGSSRSKNSELGLSGMGGRSLESAALGFSDGTIGGRIRYPEFLAPGMVSRGRKTGSTDIPKEADRAQNRADFSSREPAPESYGVARSGLSPSTEAFSPISERSGGRQNVAGRTTAPALKSEQATGGLASAGLQSRQPQGAGTNLPDSLGVLAARFESAADGPAAIGYDPAGGTSYGTFQIASRPGTMGEFLGFLDQRAPEWANRLRAAGTADTGGRDGAMPRVWRRIAAESPERFEALQKEFIRENHFEPARRRILERTGLDVGNSGRPLREVVFSTAVQHGAAGAAGIVAEAAGRSGMEESVLIREIYAVRHARFAEHQPEMASNMARRYAAEAAAAKRLGIG
jgi:hypothetical protein